MANMITRCRSRRGWNRPFNRMVLGLVLLPVSCLSLVCATLSAAPSSQLYAWYVESNNYEIPLEHVDEYHPNAFFIQFIPGPNEPGGSWATPVEDLSLHDDYPRIAKTGAARANAEKLRAYFRTLTSRTKAEGISTYLMTGELVYPRELFEQYPAMRDPDQDAFWKFEKDRANEVLTALPDLDGFIVYFAETPHKIYELQGGQRVENYIAHLISAYLEVCEAHHKRLIICTMVNYYPDRLQTLLRAIRHIPHSDNFAVLNWICPSDWGLFRVINPAIGNVGGHPEILNFDFSGENWGEGVLPLSQLDFFAERLRGSLARGANVAGISGFVNWWIPQNIFDTPSEVNLYGAPLLLENPGRDPKELYEAWLAKRYGEPAARLLVPAFRNSFRVVTESRQVLGFWAMEFPKSEFASPGWIDYSLRADSPAVWDPNFRVTEEALFNPDERTLDDVLREKDQAAAQAQAAVDDIRSAQKYIPSTKYEPLLHAFTRERDEARALRPYFELFFRYKMWAEDYQAVRLLRMRQLQAELLNWADYFQRTYPDDSLHDASRIREYVAEMNQLLAGKPLPKIDASW